jgi:hypothetical protein
MENQNYAIVAIVPADCLVGFKYSAPFSEGYNITNTSPTLLINENTSLMQLLSIYFT